jgi:hypothetical protein
MPILHQLIKHAGDLPMWVHVPGLPFNIPVPGDRKERLSGMHEWVPIDTIERVRQGREQGLSPEEIVSKERQQSSPKSVALSAGVGGAAGGLLARVLEGEKGVAPFKEIAEKGVNKKSLLGLKSLPLKMRLLPVAGAGAGALASIISQKADAPNRERGAREALRGLAVEDLQTANEVMNATKSVKDLQKEGMDDTSATLLAAGAGGLGGYAAGTHLAKLLPIGGAAVGALLLAALVASIRKNNRPEPAWSGYPVKSAASTSFAARSGGAGKNYGKVTEDPPMPGPGADGSKSVFKTPGVSAAAVSKVKPGAVGAAGGVLGALKKNKGAGAGSISNG